MKPRRTPRRQSIWEKGTWCSLAALPVGLGLLAITSALLGVVVLVAEPLPWMVTWMGGIALGISGYGMGWYAGFCRRCKGLKTGLACGVALSILLRIAGAIWLGKVGGWGVPAILLPSSGIGGIVGVNQKHTRPPK